MKLLPALICMMDLGALRFPSELATKGTMIFLNGVKVHYSQWASLRDRPRQQCCKSQVIPTVGESIIWSRSWPTFSVK